MQTKSKLKRWACDSGKECQTKDALLTTSIRVEY